MFERLSVSCSESSSWLLSLHASLLSRHFLAVSMWSPRVHSNTWGSLLHTISSTILAVVVPQITSFLLRHVFFVVFFQSVFYFSWPSYRPPRLYTILLLMKILHSAEISLNCPLLSSTELTLSTSRSKPALHSELILKYSYRMFLQINRFWSSKWYFFLSYNVNSFETGSHC